MAAGKSIGESHLALKALQIAILIAVLWANIYFAWTPNGYLAAAWAFCAAYGLTVIPIQIYDWWRLPSRLRVSDAPASQKRLNNRGRLRLWHRL